MGEKRTQLKKWHLSYKIVTDFVSRKCLCSFTNAEMPIHHFRYICPKEENKNKPKKKKTNTEIRSKEKKWLEGVGFSPERK